MTTRSAFSLAMIMVVLALATSCASTDKNANKGSVAMTFKASGAFPAPTTLAAGDSGPLNSGPPTSATIVISEASARTTGGTFETISGTFPKTIDVLALTESGGSVTLPAGLLPDGSYSAIQITITEVSITLNDGTVVTITPPGSGWQTLIAVNFDVIAGQETTITLNLHCERSFRFLNDHFEFEPDIEIEEVGGHHH